MIHKKPEPLPEIGPKRPQCPVCGEVSYSKEGIHPQCAQAQADSERMKNLKTGTAKPVVRKSWHKQCPRCRESIHIRKKTCECGHQFG